MLFALALSLVSSNASAQGARPTRGFEVSVLLGISGQFRTDLGSGTSDDVQPISLSYGFNFSERHGLVVQLTPSTDLEEVPGFEGAYASSSVLYKATFPTKIDQGKLEPFVLVGLSRLAWRTEVFSITINDESGVGLALGASVDYYISPELSLRLLLFDDLERDTGDINASVSAISFGVGFHF